MKKEAKYSKQLRDELEEVYNDCVTVLIPDAYRTQKKMYDFHVFIGGKVFCIELKRTQGKTFNIKNKIYDYQFDRLEKIEKISNIPAFFVILFDDSKKGFCVSSKQLKFLQSSFGSSIKETTFEEATLYSFERRKINRKTRWEVEKIVEFAFRDQ